MNEGNALVLSGGGARGAFQAGALQALVEIAEELNLDQPFPIVCGVSAGGINAAYYAATCQDPLVGTKKLVEFWSNLHSKQVFRSDLGSLGKTGIRWAWDLLLGGLKKTTQIKSLLDTAPLRNLLEDHLPIRQIERNLAAGLIEAVEVTASNYANSESISFVESNYPERQWQRLKRRSQLTKLSIEHVMATASIPLFFPPVKIGRDFYGDGCLRNPAPLSPAIRLGGRKLFIVGVRKQLNEADDLKTAVKPTIARILSVMLNAILLDSTEVDLERLARLNGILRLMTPQQQEDADLKVVNYVFIRPTEDIGDYASRQVKNLPTSLRYLIEGLGSSGEASEVISYLLFDPAYCKHLVQMGYRDTLKRKDEIKELFLA